jgi:hypothetical protein
MNKATPSKKEIIITTRHQKSKKLKLPKKTVKKMASAPLL